LQGSESIVPVLDRHVEVHIQRVILDERFDVFLILLLPEP
jgi:hypothetical protein